MNYCDASARCTKHLGTPPSISIVAGQHIVCAKLIVVFLFCTFCISVFFVVGSIYVDITIHADISTENINVI